MGDQAATAASSDEAADAGERMLGELLDRSHYATPEEIPGLVVEAAREAGAGAAKVYITDYEQRALVEIPPGAGDEPLSIDTTLAGRAFRTASMLEHATENGEHRMYVPLLDGTERIGVLEVTTDEVGEVAARRLRRLASLTAELLVSKQLYGDALARARRLRPLSMAAEMQWSLLPPLTFSDGRVTVSGILEPSYRIAGDTFDYALNDNLAHVAIIDAMGHGFEATMMAAVAANAYRHARRGDLTLEQRYAEMDETIAEYFGPDRFATALLMELDATDGTLRWLCAGHPLPLLLRNGQVVARLESEPTLPVGFGDHEISVAEVSLEPGDRVLLVTDGVLESRSSQGEFFGETRLADFLERATAAGLPSPETLRRLAHAVLDHQDGELDDDATVVLLEWSGRERDDPYAPRT